MSNTYSRWLCSVDDGYAMSRFREKLRQAYEKTPAGGDDGNGGFAASPARSPAPAGATSPAPGFLSPPWGPAAAGGGGLDNPAAEEAASDMGFGVPTPCEHCRHWVIPIWTRREPYCALGHDPQECDGSDFLDNRVPLPPPPPPAESKRHRSSVFNFQPAWFRGRR